MSSGDTAQRLRDLLSTLESSLRPAERVPPPPDGSQSDALHTLVYSFMLWESRPSAASRALARLYGEIIDPNELRVALPEEIAEWCGESGELALERAARLRACLNDVYRREHGVCLDRLASLSKREAREYLDSLEGIPAFVAARVCLLAFGGHAVPLDLRLRRMLEAEGALEAELDLAEAERWLERQVRASESEQVALLLDAWRGQAMRKRPRAGPSKAAPRKKAAGGKPKPAPKRGSPKRPKKDS